MTDAFKGEVALVTGGTAGIGLGIAQELARQGATVYIFGTDPERGEDAAKLINSTLLSPSVLFQRVDVTQTAAVESAIKSIITTKGKIDILVNNAGIVRDQLLIRMTEEEWDIVLNTNVKSCYNCCKPVVRSMMKAKKGKIINISSVIGLIGNPGQVNYAASKGAVIAFTKALALELASRNIQVNCVAPGFIETRMTNTLTVDQKESILARIPLGRMGSPQDIANAVIFLAGSASDYITGQVLTIDGGMVM